MGFATSCVLKWLLCCCGILFLKLDVVVTGGVEHGGGLYMMADMPPEVDNRPITVEELMRANFQHGWPDAEVVVLQLESRERASINWRHLVAKYGQQEPDDKKCCC